MKKGEEIATDQERKGEIFTEAYEELLGMASARDESIDLDFLDMEGCDLHELESIFSVDEVWNTIEELPSDWAPGPDGFIGAFYQRACLIIKHDVMAVMMKLYVGDGQGFSKLNRAHIVLIPKRPDAEVVGDFRPIILTHSAAKLFAKMLALRARKRMKEVVAANQSTLI